MPALINSNGIVDEVEKTYMTSSSKPVMASIVFRHTAELPIDHVNISYDLYSTLYKSHDHREHIYASIQLISELDDSSFRLFHVHPAENLKANTVEFHNMTEALKYKNQLTIHSCWIVPVLPPPTLSNVIICFPPEVYELVTRISKSKLYTIFANDNGNKIFRKHDLIRNFNAKVIQCEPFDQGKFCETTKLTFVKANEVEPVAIRAQKLPAIKDVRETSIDIDFLNPFLAEEKSKSVRFGVAALQHKHHACIPFPEKSDDDELFGYVRVRELSKLGLFSGDLAKIIVDETTERYIRIFGLTEPNNHCGSTIYISPLYYINLKCPSSVQVVTLNEDERNIPLAKRVTIARISSPITLTKTYQHLFLSNLKNHFENKKRVVFENQLIATPIDTILASSLPTDNSELPEVIPEGNCDCIAWFKVSQIESEGEADTGNAQFLVDSTVTKMIQSGTETKAPPSDASNCYSYFGLGSSFQFTKKSSRDFKSAHSLAKIIKTCVAEPSLSASVLLHSQARGTGKSFLVNDLALELGVHLIELDGYEVLNQGSDMKTMGLIRGKLDRIVAECTPLVVHLQHIEALCRQKDQQQGNKQDTLTVKLSEMLEECTKSPGIILIASTCDLDNLSVAFRNKFKFEVEITMPSQNERAEIFRYLLSKENLREPEYLFHLRDDTSLDTLTLQSAGLTPRDISSIIKATMNMAIDDFESLAKNLNIPARQLYYMNGGYINLAPAFFEKSINDARSKFSDSIGAPKIPDVKWEDVGGLDLVKDEILDTIDMPLKHPELFANGLKKRSGILFYGPPGTGKTLLAKAIATNFSLNFFSVKGPELLNMYIGESEANIRKVFQKARDAKPCVVFFDELDSVAPKRGNQGDSGGVMDRIVSQLLAELDGMSSSGGDGVFVVGATNRPDLLDDALLRPGRFDKMLYLGISDTDEKQKKILQALTRKFDLDPELDLMEVARSCAYNFTGADFYALCSDSILNAMVRLSGEVDEKIKEYNKANAKEINTRYFFEHLAQPNDLNIIVRKQDFIRALEELNPSVSQDELNHYLKIKESFEQA